MQKPFKNQKIWVTGASSGIGYACVLAFAKQGASTLVISGRNEAKLAELKQKLPNTQVMILPFDVTDKVANLAAAKQIEATLGGIDVVFLNAGASNHFNIKRFDSAIFEEMVKLNYLSLVYGVEAALPLLRKSKQPHLVGMSSIAAYGGLPSAGSYCASKAAARVFLQSVKIDLIPEKIPVSVVCPGFIKTPLTDKNDFPMPFIMGVNKAATIITNGIAKKHGEIHFPKRMSVMLKLMQSLPANWTARLMRMGAPQRK